MVGSLCGVEVRGRSFSREVGCVWDASISFRRAQSAHRICEIAQIFRVFDRDEGTLNLRVVGSIPTRLTILAKALSAFS